MKYMLDFSDEDEAIAFEALVWATWPVDELASVFRPTDAKHPNRVVIIGLGGEYQPSVRQLAASVGTVRLIEPAAHADP